VKSFVRETKRNQWVSYSLLPQLKNFLPLFGPSFCVIFITDERSQLQFGVFSGGGMLLEEDALYFEEEDDDDDEECC
jgi:hypothetical protein